MKKITILFLFMLLGVFFPCFAENVQLHSQTGIVKQVVYDDINLSDQENTRQIVTVEVVSGEYKGATRQIINMLTGNPYYDIMLKKGDKVVLHVEPVYDEITSPDDVDFFIADIKRENQVWFFAGLFSLLLILIGKMNGVRSILSIILTILMIFFILVPMILKGINPVISALLIGIMSTLVTIYLVGGFNFKSTSAIIGTSASLLFAGVLSALCIHSAHLTGFSGEDNIFLYSTRPDLNFTGILSASIIISALGAVMDTSISIASTINEIYETDKSLSIKKLFTSGMNVGRDIIGTMSNTLILVYLGGSLPLLMLADNIDFNKFFNLNQVATEILSALTGSIAILICVPLTAIVSAVLIKKYYTIAK